jgi:hypothetical protein
MRSTRSLCAAVLLLGACAAGGAAAHGVRFGFHFGIPLYPPAWYYPPPVYYYPPPVVAMPAAPPVYVERNEPQVTAPEHYWYYCPDTQTYYPYVRECASTWQRVSPRPPGT